ncbi:MAG TPA: hypothetical protein ENK04_05490 [Gammaproteobacteria bacterium]|nr:hypothetical protein [Gammaproteobacteria bacterium]
MSEKVIEMATIKLLPGKTEQDLLQASEKFQQDFVNGLKGFISRELVHVKDNEYADIVHWQSMEDAKAVLTQEMSSDACMGFFSLMEMDKENPEAGVTHFKSLALYEAGHS